MDMPSKVSSSKYNREKIPALISLSSSGSVSHSVTYNSLRPHELEPARLLCPLNSPGKILERVPFPSKGDLPYPGIEPRSPALQADSLPSEPPGKPSYIIVEKDRK